MMPSCVQPVIAASGDVCSRLENKPVPSSTYGLITLASASVEVTGSRILKLTVRAAYEPKQPTKTVNGGKHDSF